jgi:hypothetical protein
MQMPELTNSSKTFTRGTLMKQSETQSGMPTLTDGSQATPQHLSLDRKLIALIVLVTSLVVSLFTFCLTEYNIQQDCKAIGAFRIDGAGFKCEVVK